MAFFRETHDQLVDETISSTNNFMRPWGEFFKGAYEIRKKYGAPMYFFVYLA